MGKIEILDYLNNKSCCLFNGFFTTKEIAAEIKKQPSNIIRDLKFLFKKGIVERNCIYGWKVAYRINSKFKSEEQNKKYIEELKKCQIQQ